MHAAFLLGTVIVLGLVAADWIAFSRKSPQILEYGFRVGHQRETLIIRRDRFDPDGKLVLPRGVAQLCLSQKAILLLPEWKRFGLKFRTAWPLNGVLRYQSLDNSAPVTLVKRMPWSSALLTGLWFLTVGGGIVAYLVSYGRAGGFSSATGAFLAVALSGLGLIVLLFGVIVVMVAYRLESRRLMGLYDELRQTMGDGNTAKN
jgi:hypothetical protein